MIPGLMSRWTTSERLPQFLRACAVQSYMRPNARMEDALQTQLEKLAQAFRLAVNHRHVYYHPLTARAGRCRACELHIRTDGEVQVATLQFA